MQLPLRIFFPLLCTKTPPCKYVLERNQSLQLAIFNRGMAESLIKLWLGQTDGFVSARSDAAKYYFLSSSPSMDDFIVLVSTASVIKRDCFCHMALDFFILKFNSVHDVWRTLSITQRRKRKVLPGLEIACWLVCFLIPSRLWHWLPVTGNFCPLDFVNSVKGRWGHKKHFWLLFSMMDIFFPLKWHLFFVAFFPLFRT